MNKHKLEKYWIDLMNLAEYRKSQKTEYFHHCTKLKYRRNIFKLGRLEGTYTDEPEMAPLSMNEDIEGVWFGISMVNNKLPDKSPYGNHMVQIPVSDLMNLLKMPTPIPIPAESERTDSDEDESSVCRSVTTLSLDDNTNVSDSATLADGRVTYGRTDNRDVVHKQVDVANKSKDLDINENLPLEKTSTCTGVSFGGQPDVTPLLFFESAFFHGSARGQSVRFVLIRSDDPNLAWCEGHLKRVDLYNNPFCRWNPTHGCLYTVRNDIATHCRFVYTDVKVIGDVTFDDFVSPPVWKQVGRVQISSHDPVFGVYSHKGS